VELCPKTVKKLKKKWGFLENWVFRECWGKTGNRGVWVAGGGWVWWRMAEGGVSVVGEVVVGVGGFGFREEKDGGGVG
jgi:hypothetical protein